MRANVVSVAAFQLSEFVMRLPLDDVVLFIVYRREGIEIERGRQRDRMNMYNAHHYHSKPILK